MKILIVDDHALFRAGLELLLTQLLASSEASLHISQAANGRQAIGMMAAGNAYDLVLLDWYMPEMQGVEALLSVRSHLPQGRLVVLSGDPHPKLVQQSIEHGATGFIPKDSPTDELAHALEVVVSGGVYLPKLLNNVHELDVTSLSSTSGTSSQVKPLKSINELFPSLSARQCEVFNAMARGLSNKLIARELNICEDTVKQHLSAVYQELNVHNRTEAVYLVSQLGLSIV